MSIYLRVEIKANDGQEAEFEAVAKQLVARAADEPGRYTFAEEYADAAATAAHGSNGRDLLAQLATTATITEFHVYGSEADGVDQVAAAIPNAIVHKQIF